MIGTVIGVAAAVAAALTWCLARAASNADRMAEEMHDHVYLVRTESGEFYDIPALTSGEALRKMRSWKVVSIERDVEGSES